MEDTLTDTEGTTIRQPGSHPFRLASAARSDVGKVRRVNEDAFLDRAEIGLWAVADGVGGESAGDRASRLIVEALGKVEVPSTAAGFLATVHESLQAVNKLLRLEAAAAGGDRLIASTVVALLVFGHHFACAWAGDSRLYLWRNGTLQQVSRDHSEVQEMVECGMLTAEEARTHPRGNVVTRAVGADDMLNLEMMQDQIRAGDTFLLCSDGLTKMLTDREIAGLIAAAHGADPATSLIEATLERGATDNVTVVIVTAVQVNDG
jgi:serine/threonine protein phosphatase PrpC